MSKTQSDFTPEQTRAIEAADKQHAAQAIADMAAAGELASELEPFSVSASTVREIRREERESRQSRDKRLDALDRDITTAMARALREINADAKTEGRTDLTRLRQLTASRKNMREVNYVPPSGSRPEQGNTPPTTTLMDRLAQRSAAPSAVPTQDEDEDRQAASGV